MLCGSIYIQGAAFHSARYLFEYMYMRVYIFMYYSNMFKNAFESIQTHHDDNLIQDNYYYLETVWEHGE